MKKVIILILISIAFAACGGGSSSGGSSPMSPKAFDNTAMDVFKKAKNSMDAFDSKITAGIKSKDFASIATAADNALAEVDAQIEKLKAANAPEGGNGYKESVLKTLNTTKEIIEIGKKYSALKEGYSQKEFSALEKEYNKKRTQLSKELKDVATASSEFSKATKK